MYPVRPLSPNASIACGVGASATGFLVARLTLLSVACAERMTAINSCKGVAYSRSGFCSGLAQVSRANSA